MVAASISGTYGVVHQNDVVRAAVDGIQRVGYALLPGVATLHNMDLSGEPVFAHLGSQAIHFVRTYRYVHGGDLRHLGKGTQRMDEYRDARQLKELLRRR